MRWLLVFLLTISTLLTYAQNDDIGSGRAILFDGVDDYIDLGDIYDDVALPITISGWIKVQPEQQAIQYPIFDSQDNLVTYNGFTLLTSTLPHVGFSMGDGKGGNNPAYRKARAGYFNTMGSWVYVTAVARSGNDIRTFMNGWEISAEYQGTSPYPMNSFSPTEVAKIGHIFANGIKYWFKGVMDELRIWNRALSEAEIRESMCKKLKGDESALIGYWNFDETSGTELRDLSPNGFHGVLKGNPTRVFSGAPIGDESVYLYTGNWSGKTLDKDGLTVTNITGQSYGVHIYTVGQVPSQTGGLAIPGTPLPYYGVFLAGDDQNSTFDFHFNDASCSAFQREDNSMPSWYATTAFSGIQGRAEIIRSAKDADVNIDLGTDLQLCDVNSLWIQPKGTSDGQVFLWSTGETSRGITVDRDGKYTVEVREGCQVAKDSITISFSKTPPAFSLGGDEAWCDIESRTLALDFNTDGYSVTWQDGSKGSSFVTADFGTYWVKVENACGMSMDSVTFSRKDLSDLKTYNFFSPDSRDDKNQYFMIDERIVGASVLVFNRWGKNVYSSFNYMNDWDGGELPSGTYFYTVMHECIEPLKGTVTLVR